MGDLMRRRICRITVAQHLSVRAVWKYDRRRQA
jgi:hypothetical protein